MESGYEKIERLNNLFRKTAYVLTCIDETQTTMIEMIVETRSDQ